MSAASGAAEGAPATRTSEAVLRRELVDTCRSFGPRRLSQGTSGNASARCGDGMLITPSALPYERMEPEDICWVGLDGCRRGDRPPSSEWRFHLRILAQRPDVGAVVHVHSPSATALACLRRPIPSFHYMVAVAGGDSIRCAAYRLFGTDALADVVTEALDGRQAALMANHGQVAVGADLEAALGLAVEVEALAEQYLLACRAGEPVLLDDDEMDEVLAHFGRYREGTLS